MTAVRERRKGTRLQTWMTVVLLVVALALEIQVQQRNDTIDKIHRDVKVTHQAADAARRAAEEADVALKVAIAASSGSSSQIQAFVRSIQQTAEIDLMLRRLFPNAVPAPSELPQFPTTTTTTP